MGYLGTSLIPEYFLKSTVESHDVEEEEIINDFIDRHAFKTIGMQKSAKKVSKMTLEFHRVFDPMFRYSKFFHNFKPHWKF